MNKLEEYNKKTLRMNAERIKKRNEPKNNKEDETLTAEEDPFKEMRTGKRKCTHPIVQQFTECCLVCGKNIYED